MKRHPWFHRPVRSGISLGIGGDPKTVIMVVVLVAIIGVAIFYIVRNATGSGASSSFANRKFPYKCLSCDQVVELSGKQVQDMFREQVKDQGDPMGGPPMGMGVEKLVCPNCGEKELVPAVKCPACDTVFVLDIDPMGPPKDDTCPNCGASYLEELRKARQGEREDK